MRRPACAPPPKIWISGSGIETGLRRQRATRHRARPALAAKACAQAIDAATVTLPPITGLGRRCRRARAAWRRQRAASARSRPGERRRDAGRDRVDRVAHVDAAQPRAAVAPVDRLARAARGTGRCDATTDAAVVHARPRPRGGTAARIPDRATCATVRARSTAQCHGVQPPSRRCRSTGVPASASADRSCACRRGSAGQAIARETAHERLLCARCMYSTGDLPSIRASISAGSERRRRASRALAPAPSCTQTR